MGRRAPSGCAKGRERAARDRGRAAWGRSSVVVRDKDAAANGTLPPMPAEAAMAKTLTPVR
jgi:hypothetical protein